MARLRVNRRIKIAKGLTVNVSKSGLSASAKVGRVTVNSRRGTTVNVAKGVSYNIPAGSKGKASPARATAARPVAVVPAGPRFVRKPWGLPGAAFWTLGIIASLLLGAIPYVGAFLLIGAVIALVVIWNVTPKRVAGERAAVASTSTPEIAPTEPVEPGN